MPKRQWEKNHLLTYNDISLRLDALAEPIRAANYDGLVILLRGGTFAGMHLAFLTGLNVHFLQYNRNRNQANWFGDKPSGQRLLLVEDSAGKGFTLANCIAFLCDAGYEVDTLVVCQMPMARVQTTYRCFDWQDDTVRVLFPWNRFRLNGESIGDSKLDHEYERTAWDLDGVFVDDMDPALYHKDLETALVMRDDAPFAPYAPHSKAGDIIITSRPDCDRERTQRWLTRFGITLPLVMRPSDLAYPSHQFKARWKGQMAIQLGYTHFVESHAEQAVLLAAAYPELRVTWWNAGNPVSVSATLSKQ